jgi:hypothetical protein
LLVAHLLVQPNYGDNKLTVFLQQFTTLNHVVHPYIAKHISSIEAHFSINIHQNIDNYIAKYIVHPTQQVVLFIFHQLATMFIHINIYNKTYIIKQGGASTS